MKRTTACTPVEPPFDRLRVVSKRAGLAFTLVELLVVVGIIALLISILLPVLSRAKEAARRTACSASLSAIGRAVHAYAGDFNGFIPLRNETSATINRVGYRDTADLQVAPLGGGGESVSRGWYQLVRRGLVAREAFLCPSDEDVDRTAYSPAGYWDFHPTATRYPISYAMQVTLCNPAGPPNRGVPIRVSDRGDLAIVADQSPFVEWQWDAQGFWRANARALTPAEDRDNNSPNHRREGQNVLYLGAQVRWAGTCLGGAERDNPWTPADGSTFGSSAGLTTARPRDKDDSFLYP